QSAAVDETPSRKSLAAEQSELFPGAGVRRGFGGGGGGGRGRQGGRNGINSAITAAPNLQLKENQRALSFEASPDGVHTAVPVVETTGESKNTFVPNYITASGYTENINSYPKVGDVHTKSTLALTTKDGKVAWLTPPEGAGKRDYSVRQNRWSSDGRTLISSIETNDHKDRWLVKVDPDSGASSVLFSDHSDAWLGGPPRNTLRWLPDNHPAYLARQNDG